LRGLKLAVTLSKQPFSLQSREHSIFGVQGIRNNRCLDKKNYFLLCKFYFSENQKDIQMAANTYLDAAPEYDSYCHNYFISHSIIHGWRYDQI
jgi:hypothetical protein